VAVNTSREHKTEEDLRRDMERRGLSLSRKRVLSDLEVATNPNHRKSLEAALAHLDRKIAELS